MKKSKFVFAVLVLGFLLLSNSVGFGYVNIVGPADFVLGNIQQPGGTGSVAESVLIIEANQDIQITFNSTGNLKRQELDRTGSGLGRYDVLETTIVNLKIYGSNAFVWSGNMDNLDGLTTPTITPDGNEKVWMDLMKVNATSDPINWSKDNKWNESDDAGLYLGSVTMTVVPVGQPPMPSLKFIPDDAEGKSPSPCIQIHNTGHEEKDDAKNVEVAITVTVGSEYVSNLSYNPVVGNIENGGFVNFSFTIITNLNWDAAPSGTEIKILIEVTREDNRPGHNVGKYTHYTLVK